MTLSRYHILILDSKLMLLIEALRDGVEFEGNQDRFFQECELQFDVEECIVTPKTPRS